MVSVMFVFSPSKMRVFSPVLMLTRVDEGLGRHRRGATPAADRALQEHAGAVGRQQDRAAAPATPAAASATPAPASAGRAAPATDAHERARAVIARAASRALSCGRRRCRVRRRVLITAAATAAGARDRVLLRRVGEVDRDRRVGFAEEQDLPVGREARARHARRVLVEELRVGVAERRQPVHQSIFARRGVRRRAATAAASATTTRGLRARVRAATTVRATAAVRAGRQRFELQVREALPVGRATSARACRCRRPPRRRVHRPRPLPAAEARCRAASDPAAPDPASCPARQG